MDERKWKTEETNDVAENDESGWRKGELRLVVRSHWEVPNFRDHVLA